MPVKALIWIVAVMLINTTALADEREPDAELLEFLADWDSGDGQWIAPFSFEQSSAAGMRRDDNEIQATQERDDEH